MESFNWDKNFFTGLDSVDNQHRRLVDLINQFSNLLVQNTIVFDDIKSTFKEVADYAVYHFTDEEALMRREGIDPRHLEPHKKIHQDFLDEVTLMRESVSEDNFDSAKHLLEFLINWLVYHILGSDQNMARQVAAIQSGVSPNQAFEREEKKSRSSTKPLLKALNNLFLQVSERNKTLIKLNESLEEKVADRTRELSKANAYLEKVSITDVLTELPNRRYAMHHLSTMWEEAMQHNSPLVCIMVDADHFKEVNDNYGHDAGDKVLTELAMTLQHSFRNDDVVCRLGGDEFFVICPDTDLEGGVHVAESVRKNVSELRVETGGKPWHGSISVGVAANNSNLKTHEELIKMADIAVYTAKQDGRNCVRTATNP